MKQILPTNFVDDILSDSMGGKRRFNLIPNNDGTYSLEDVTEYDQLGSQFGSANINATNNAVNESADKNKILETLTEINATTEKGYMADALAIKELNNSLTNYVYIVSKNADYTCNANATTSVYADIPELTGYKFLTVFPVSSGSSNVFFYVCGTSAQDGIPKIRMDIRNMSSNAVNASAGFRLIYIRDI